jgi:4-amino-4-deoxy-L-arabinose transferase-like glycosyltransferase
MGHYKTIILEFPLPEAVMALGYHVFGLHLSIARCQTLIFFVGSLVYLFLLVSSLLYARLAWITALLYAFMPLSLFYSRAIHIDFFAVCFAHAMTYHLVRSFQTGSLLHFLCGTVAASIAFLVKAPYAFYFGLPLLVAAWWTQRPRTMLHLAAAFGIAAALFLLWRRYVEVINDAAPNWFFIPSYMKFVHMGWWYYGPLQMRWDPEVWGQIGWRFLYDVSTPIGVALFVVGMSYAVFLFWHRRHLADVFLWTWLVGVLVYVLIFLNLNFLHDYYQIPLLAITAVFAALGIEAIATAGDRLLLGTASWTRGVLCLLFVAYAVFYAETTYYPLDAVRIEAGRIIEHHTPRDALVIVAPNIVGTDPRDPRLLCRAKRHGWSIYKPHLNDELLMSLKFLGANYLALVIETDGEVTEIYGFPATTYAMRYPRWKVIIANLWDELKPGESYPLIEQDQVSIEHWQRQPSGEWAAHTTTSLDAIIPMSSLSVTLPLREVYLDVFGS